MTLQGQVQVAVSARVHRQSGLTSSAEDHTVDFTVDVGDCTTVWSDRRVIGLGGYDQVNLAQEGFSVVKLLHIRNLSESHQIALSAGWTGSQFSVFLPDTAAWNFSPMINLGSLSLRGYPIREGGTFMLSCPNSDGFGTTAGGSLLRVGGTGGEEYEIYVMGT